MAWRRTFHPPSHSAWSGHLEHRAQVHKLWKQILGPSLLLASSSPCLLELSACQRQREGCGQNAVGGIWDSIHPTYSLYPGEVLLQQLRRVAAVATITVTTWTCRPVAQNKWVQGPGQRQEEASTQKNPMAGTMEDFLRERAE